MAYRDSPEKIPSVERPDNKRAVVETEMAI